MRTPASVLRSCPNLCTGGDNYHGRFEYIPVEDMEKCVEMLISLLTNVE